MSQRNRISPAWALALMLACCSAYAQRTSGAAAFLEGLMNGMQQAEQNKIRRAEADYLRARTARLEQENAAKSESKKAADMAVFYSRWQSLTSKTLVSLGRRQRSNDNPNEWSDDGLAIEGASMLSTDLIEVFRVSELSPALSSRLHAGSMVDRMVVDCKKGTITGLEVGIFQLSNGIGEPINHTPVFQVLARPFAAPWATQIFDKSCDRLQELNWSNTVLLFMEKARIEDGIDYTEPLKSRQIDELVKTFGAVASQRGMSDVDLVASKWALEQAHAAMKIMYPAQK